MGRFREKMDRDMQIRGYSTSTRDIYLRCVRDFVKYFMVRPDRLSHEDINRYQQYLIEEKKVSVPYFNQAVSAIRFFYITSLGRKWEIRMLPYQRTARSLPEILSRQEVSAIFDATTNIKHRVILMTVYSGGLRVSEVVGLSVSDIDNDRRVIRINKGKGQKDRYVMLSLKLASVLQEYMHRHKPGYWLFPGQKPGTHMVSRSAQKIFRKARTDAGITKNVTIHSLRHSFATHLMEDGANIRVIQSLLGHMSLRSTSVYTHVAGNYLSETQSPMDRTDRP